MKVCTRFCKFSIPVKQHQYFNILYNYPFKASLMCIYSTQNLCISRLGNYQRRIQHSLSQAPLTLEQRNYSNHYSYRRILAGRACTQFYHMLHNLAQSLKCIRYIFFLLGPSDQFLLSTH